MVRLNDFVDSLNGLNIKIIIDEDDDKFDYIHNNPVAFKGKVSDFRTKYRLFDEYYVLSVWKSHERNNDLNIFVRKE